MIKGGKSMTMQTQALFDSRAFACFINKELVWQHNLALVEKVTPVTVEMIDGGNLFSRPIMHETKSLTITFGSYSNKIVFNVISYLTNPIIIGLSWLILHNPRVDWKMKSFHIELVNKITPNMKLFQQARWILNMIMHVKTTKTRQRMQKFKRERDIGGNQRSKHFKSLFVG